MTVLGPLPTESQVVFASVLESTDDLIWAVDAEQFKLLFFNSRFHRYFLTKYGLDIKVGDSVDDVLVFEPQRAQQWRSYFQRTLETGAFCLEYANTTNDLILWLSFNQLVGNGKCFGISVFAKDITARIRAEQALQITTDSYARLIRASPWLISVTTYEGARILDINDQFAKTLGYDRENLIGRSVYDFGIWANPEVQRLFREQLRTTGRFDNHEVCFRTSSGRLLYCRLSAHITDFDGQPCTFVSAVDVTEQRAAELALRESEARYRTLVDYAPEAIVVINVDDNCRFIDVNDNACQLLGYSRDQLTRLDPPAVSPPYQSNGESSAALARARIEETVRGQRPSFEWIHQNSKGESIECEVRLVLLPASDRRLIRGSIIDISERKRLARQAAELQARLDQAQRLEAIGTLAGGIAHDFNNILGAIVGCLDVALMELPADDSTVRPALSEIDQAATRATGLVRQILAFSRQIPQDKQAVHVARVVKEVMKLIRATLPSTIIIEERYETDACVMADPGQLHQIVMNLCTNAGLALREHGGSLRVSVAACKDIPLEARQPDLNPGPFTRLTVKDSGCGIAPEHLGRIFEPFFTTRTKGQGTGLGLSVVHGIVKSSGGTVTVTSELGHGTTFDVFLPICNASPSDTADSVAACRGTERILYVDDEVALTKLAQRGLTILGYQVSVFNDPEEAFLAFGADPSRFDVIVTDMTMPKCTGEQLALRAHAVRANVPIIMVTGFSDKITADQARVAGIREFIEKPVRPSELARIIRALCDTRQ